MLLNNFVKTSQLLLKQKTIFNQTNKVQAYFSGRKSFAEKRQNINESTTAQPFQQQQTTFEQGSTADYVANNAGLNAFIARVYKTSGLGVLGALATSQVAIGMGLPFASPMGSALGGFGLAIVSMFGLYKTQPKYVREMINGNELVRTENSPLRLGFYGTFMGGLGISSSVLFAMVQMQNPVILPTAIGISTAIFGSASLYAYMRPKDSLLTWGKSLYSGLLGMIGLQITGLLTSAVIGPNLFSHCIHRADTFIGVGLFSAMVAYDTHCAIVQYEQGNADHLMVSLDFALDFWNILTRVVQILSMFSGRD